ncbi:MAG: GNAT family N-acetyltransferase, partial [Sphingomonas hengshuiensis]
LSGEGFITFVRQRYTRHFIDLTTGFDAYLAALSANTRSGIKRKAKKLAQVSGGALDIRRYRNPAEIEAFHTIARGISAKTYQEKLLGGGLPDDPGFIGAMVRAAAADAVRAWLLYIGDRPVAYLYCSMAGGTVRYDHVGHDPDVAELSPGSVLQIEAMRDLFAEGCHRRFDFTEGEGQHKRQFATGGVACVDVLLLRPTIANRATLLALAGFDGAMALGKRLVERFGLQALARRIRR